MELHATTKPGARLVELAEQLAIDLEPGVDAHDRAGTYTVDHVDVLRDHGWFAAAAPAELGGGGVVSVHDLLVAASRLARGDAATAIGANMHTLVVVNLARQWAAAVDDADRQARSAAVIEMLVEGRIAIAVAISEPGQDLTTPSTRAEPVDGGWRITGRKIFCTMSPGADVLLTSVSYVHRTGEQRYGFVQVPAGAPGLVVHDDWDALGMRTSGSCSVSLDGVLVPGSALVGGFPVGSAAGFARRNLASGAFHASAALGIAERAHALALEPIRARIAAGDAVDGATRGLVADDEIDLHAARAALARAGHVVDAHHQQHADGAAGDDVVLEVFAEVQAAKTVVTQAAGRVVDRALVLSGGRGYRASTPLARAVGDVRAVMFMNPLNTTRGEELLADRALGVEVALH
jgi:alkylation response protein AidB-like acyl-CoA dehydrogenase